MELREYLKVFKRYIALIILLTVGGASLGYFYARQLPTGFRASQTFFLAPQASGQNNLEANNAQELARNFTDTAVAIIASSAFQRQLTSAGQTITVKKNAPQVLTISAHSPRGEDASALIVKSKELFNSRFGSPGATLEEIGSAQIPQSIQIAPLIYTLAAALAGFAFAIFTISLKVYFKV